MSIPRKQSSILRPSGVFRGRLLFAAVVLVSTPEFSGVLEHVTCFMHAYNFLHNPGVGLASVGYHGICAAVQPVLMLYSYAVAYAISTGILHGSFYNPLASTPSLPVCHTRPSEPDSLP